MAYIYQADVWCDDCGRDIRRRLTAASKAPDNPRDEWSYDSDDFPKRADEGVSDCPQHCAADEHCINAMTLPSGRKIGVLLGGLTRDGVEYVKQAGAGEVVALWRTHYDL
jgi:hypothetical protein